MLTLKIDNSELESFIKEYYGYDIQDFLKDFTAFVKTSLSDNYPSITSSEAKRRVANAIKEIDEGKAVMLTQEAYDKEMKEFMDSL